MTPMCTRKMLGPCLAPHLARALACLGSVHQHQLSDNIGAHNKKGKDKEWLPLRQKNSWGRLLGSISRFTSGYFCLPISWT